MLWTLLIWAVVGLVAVCMVWPVMVLVRAHRNEYDVDLYGDVVIALLDEDNAKMKAKYNPVIYAILIVFWNLLWPYKLIWMTKTMVPRFDERYENLVLERLEKGELA